MLREGDYRLECWGGDKGSRDRALGSREGFGFRAYG